MNHLDEIIEKIAALQSVGQPPFDAGLFPASRSNALIVYHRLDTTVFFTASIVFTLQRLQPWLSPKSRDLVAQIAQKAQANYAAFQNKDGLATYNFWKTRPSQHFPNGYIFRHFEHFRIPDDVDDTALIYLTTPRSEAENQWLKHKLTLHANLTKLQVKNTYPEYRGLRAYSTWFGKNMYIEFDVCVLCNLMYWIFENKLPLNQHDTDSLAYIKSVVETKRYLTEPFRCAHQYPRTVAIVYHLARLLGAFDVAELASIKTQLIEDAQRLLQQPQRPLDRVALHIALLRLGVMLPALPPVETIATAADFKDFYFFIAGLLTAYEHPVLYRLAQHPLWHMKWQCEAHCWTLLAEYEALRQL